MAKEEGLISPLNVVVVVGSSLFFFLFLFLQRLYSF